MTITAEFIHSMCEGTTAEEVASRSKILGRGLRHLRSLERDVRTGRATPEQLQQAWSRIIESASRAYRRDFKVKPDISHIQSELGFVDDELQLPWHNRAAFGFEHHCLMQVHDEVLDMGTYHVDIVTKECAGQPYVVVYPLKDCFTGFTGTLHPHVSDGQLCMGELRQHLYRAWVNNNIQAMVDMVRSTLDTYNPNSPYQGIDKWLEHDLYCSKCHRHIPDKSDRMLINPHGMPRELRGVWDTCLTFDSRSEHHPFYRKDFHDGRRRLHNYPDGTFRDVVVCRQCFNDMKDHAFRTALRQAVNNHDYEIRIRRRASRHVN